MNPASNCHVWPVIRHNMHLVLSHSSVSSSSIRIEGDCRWVDQEQREAIWLVVYPVLRSDPRSGKIMECTNLVCSSDQPIALLLKVQ